MATASKIMLKLLVDKNSSKVLFAEADKAFVDFLFSILALPLGTVTKLLKQHEGMVGSFSALYESIEALSDSYLQSELSKQTALCPKVKLPSTFQTTPRLKRESDAYVCPKFYRCSNCCVNSKLTGIPHKSCPLCFETMEMVDAEYLHPPTKRVRTSDVKLSLSHHCDSKYVTEHERAKCPPCLEELSMDVSCPNCEDWFSMEVSYLVSSSSSTATENRRLCEWGCNIHGDG